MENLVICEYGHTCDSKFCYHKKPHKSLYNRCDTMKERCRHIDKYTICVPVHSRFNVDIPDEVFEI